MKSKILRPGVTLLAGVLVVFVTACAGDEPADEPTAEDPTDEEATSDEPADEPADEPPDDETLSLRISSEAAPGTIAADMLDLFEELVEDRAPNVDVEVFIGGALYNDEEAVQAISDGRLEMNMSVPSWMAGLEPGMGVFNLPYVFDDDEEFARVFDEEIGEILNERLAPQNIRGLTMIPMTGRIGIWMNDSIPMDAIDQGDLGQVSLRTFGGAPQEQAVEAVGGRPVAIAAPEVPTSLETGVIDGVLTGIPAWGAQFGEELPFGVVPGAWHSGVVIWVNTGWFDALPEAVSQAIQESVSDISAETRVRVRESEEQLLDDAEASGHTIIILTEEQREVWREKMADVPRQFEDEIGTDIIDVIVRDNG